MSNTNTTKGLKLLDDRTIDCRSDAFNHEVYAELLRDVLAPGSNEPGIAVGLFGKWGQGKSCIITMLRDLLETTHGKQVKTVWFNAWEARGDSIRRQLLLSILDAINPTIARKLRREAGLDALSDLTATPKDHFVVRLKAWVGLIIRLWWVPGAAVLLILLTAWLVSLAWHDSTHQELLVQAISVVIAVLSSMLVFALSRVQRTASVHIGSDQSIKSHAIRYPEQFIDYFRVFASRYCTARLWKRSGSSYRSLVRERMIHLLTNGTSHWTA